MSKWTDEDQPTSVITKAGIGWNVTVTQGWHRWGSKSCGAVSPWWRLTRRAALAKAARVIRAITKEGAS